MNKRTEKITANPGRRSAIGNERGIALVMALIITLVVFLLIMSTVYVTTTSTKISGAGKRYASASEAADGAVEVMKDAINLTTYGEQISALPLTNTSGLATALSQINSPTKVTLNLSGTSLFQTYTAEIVVERLYSQAIPGGRLEFARSAGGSGGTAVYYKINAVVTGPNNSRAETTALYRFVG
jgi:Tfp pilus assembly protein PilX